MTKLRESLSKDTVYFDTASLLAVDSTVWDDGLVMHVKDAGGGEPKSYMWIATDTGTADGESILIPDDLPAQGRFRAMAQPAPPSTNVTRSISAPSADPENVGDTWVHYAAGTTPEDETFIDLYYGWNTQAGGGGSGWIPISTL